MTGIALQWAGEKGNQTQANEFSLDSNSQMGDTTGCENERQTSKQRGISPPPVPKPYLLSLYNRNHFRSGRVALEWPVEDVSRDCQKHAILDTYDRLVASNWPLPYCPALVDGIQGQASTDFGPVSTGH